jgi:hypothetical protein
LKGKDRFTEDEVAEIRLTLQQVRRSDRDDQKQLREALRRKYRFYISDFTASKRGFTAEDFEALVESGRVTVTP